MSLPSQSAEAINRQDELPESQIAGVNGENKDLHGNGQHTELVNGHTSDLIQLGDSAPQELKPNMNDSPTMVISTDLQDFSNMDAETESDVKGKAVETEHSTSQEPTTSSEDVMESSTITIRPDVSRSASSNGDILSPGEQNYLDPTPSTPSISQPPSRSASNAAPLSHSRRAPGSERSPTRSDAGFDDKVSATSENDQEAHSRSEIQSIMDQFSEEGQGPGHEEIMSPRLEFAGPLLGSPVQHPPRKSSLEPLNANSAGVTHSMQDLRISPSPAVNHQYRDPTDIGPTVPPKPGSIRSFGSRIPDDRYTAESPLSPPLYRPPPPEPEPEPDLPFDFHRFLEQLRHRTADPVAKFLRSFLQEFGKKQWMVHEQVKIIGDFLLFITNKMGQCDVWREVSDAEFDNAREGMEKLVMNRLYTQTFSPAIPPPQPIPGAKPKRRGAERPMGPGRRGQHQEDVERDEILAQKVGIYGWIKEEHLDIAPVGDSGKRFLVLAQQELLKIKTYRAPRDKIICVLNCCKVIFGLLKHSKTDTSADSFMPLLIYVVLQANPEHLVSNVQYILRFRNQEKLAGEAGYYLSSLLGAVQFIENLDRTTLTISDEDFEKNVEAAVSAIAEKHQAEEVVQSAPPTQLSEKSTLSRPEVTPRHSMEGESSIRKSTSSAEDDSSENLDEKSAISGLLRTVQRPLSSIGRIFSEESSSGPVRTPAPGNTPSPRVSTDGPHLVQQRPGTASSVNARDRLGAEDSAARQASAEAAEAHRIQRAEHANVVETLAGMFPDLDREIISDVVTQKEGRVGLAVDACLALSS